MVSIRAVSLLDRLRRRRDRESGPVKKTDLPDAASDPTHGPNPTRLPDPSKVPQARGSWEEAAIVNTRVTDLVKREIGTVTPPWKK